MLLSVLVNIVKPTELQYLIKIVHFIYFEHFSNRSLAGGDTYPKLTQRFLFK